MEKEEILEAITEVMGDLKDKIDAFEFIASSETGNVAASSGGASFKRLALLQVRNYKLLEEGFRSQKDPVTELFDKLMRD